MSQQHQKKVVVRRADRPGDLGWVVMAHGESYDQQFGWDSDFEVLVAEIVADYGAKRDPAREAAWIAELDGRRVGCTFLVAGDRPTVAKLRLLLVMPEGRGFGLGTRLVEECLSFAREAGYEQVTLWTNDVLVAARKIYQSIGFTLADEEHHRSFGHDLVGQNWTLDLHTGAAGSNS
ncbi:GNAT family N-acetyltransferase [Nocardia sp. IBHARD005]|uniref:GNAT family N-acetyltransferase n=1 Tax=Nocardia sp. IBHARD005 TaxID=3457765 RepID=UPI0040586C2F